MPATTPTKTTGETGRKVPVPRRWMRNGAACRAASSRWRTTPAMSASATSEGGSSVMWEGISAAESSPRATRYSCSCAPQGSGTATETPMVGTRRTLPAAGGRGPGNEAHPVIDVGQGAGCHRGGARGPLLQDPVELGPVLEQLQGPVTERRHEVDQDVGQV